MSDLTPTTARERSMLSAKVRGEKAAIKARAAKGDLTVFFTDHPHLTVDQLLRACPGIGATRARQILLRAKVFPQKLVARLTKDERTAILSALPSRLQKLPQRPLRARVANEDRKDESVVMSEISDVKTAYDAATESAA